MQGKQATIQKWGNSLAIRLPQDLITETKKNKELKDLVKKITPKNIHKEIDWGEVEGKEIW